MPVNRESMAIVRLVCKAIKDMGFMVLLSPTPSPGEKSKRREGAGG